MHLGRNCCSPEAELIALLNFSIIEKRHLNKQHVQNFRIESCAKQHIYLLPVQEKSVYSDSN